MATSPTKINGNITNGSRFTRGSSRILRRPSVIKDTKITLTCGISHILVTFAGESQRFRISAANKFLGPPTTFKYPVAYLAGGLTALQTGLVAVLVNFLSSFIQLVEAGYRDRSYVDENAYSHCWDGLNSERKCSCTTTS